MFTVFIIKPEVAGMMTMTQCLSSHDPIEKSSISHSYISVSSSEAASVGHGGDIHWVPNIALALWPSVECLYDVCQRSHEGLHLPQPTIPGTLYEPVLPSTPAVRRGHLGWYLPLLSATKVLHDEESDSDTHLTPTVSLDFDPLEPSYLSYHVESDPSECSRPLVIRLTFDSSSSSAAPHHVPPPVYGRGFIRTHAVPHGHGRARGGGHDDDTLGGFGNGYLLFDGWLGQYMRSRAQG